MWNYHTSFSMQNSKVKLFEDDKVAFLEGNRFCIYDTNTQTREHIISERRGFCSFDTNPRYRQILLAEYGLNPKVYLYNYDLELIEVFEGVCTLDITDIVISYRGERALIVTGCPDYAFKMISLQDLEIKKVIDNKVAPDYLSTVFNPQRDRVIAILNKSSILIAEIRDILKPQEYSNYPELYQDIQYFDQPNLLQEAQDPHNLNETAAPLEIVAPTPLEDQEFYSALEWNCDDSIFVGTSKGQLINLVVSFTVGEDKSLYVTYQERLRVSCSEHITGFINTQLHVLASTTSSKIQFFEKKDVDGTILVKEKNPAKNHEFEEGEIQSFFYNQAMTQMYITTPVGELFMLPLKAEKFQEAEQYEDEYGDEAVDNTEAEVVSKLLLESSIHPIVFTGVLFDANTAIVIDRIGSLFVYDLTQNEGGSSPKMISKTSLMSEITTAVLSPARNLLLVGSSQGCLRLFDVSQPNSLRLIFEKKIDESKSVKKVVYSQSGEQIALFFEGDNMVYIMSGLPKDELKFYGTSEMRGTIEDICWAQRSIEQMPEQYTHFLEVCVRNGLITQMAVPFDAVLQDTPQPFDENTCIHFSKIVDHDIKKITVDRNSGDVVATGAQLYFNRYKHKTFAFNLPKKVKQPGSPEYLIEAHQLQASFVSECGRSEETSSLFVSGSQDGSILLVDLDSGSSESYHAHNYQSGGTSHCSLGPNGNIIVSGGFDGSIFVFTRPDFTILEENKEELADLGEFEVSNLETLPVGEDSNIKNFRILLEEADHRAKQSQKEVIQTDMITTVNSIKERLEELLQTNEESDQLEKLDREEFCLDIEKRDSMMKDANNDVQEIVAEANFTILKEELTHDKIKLNTFEKQTDNLRTITGFQEPTLVFNFPLIKREKVESRKLQLLKNLRFMELKEKQWRAQTGKEEYIDLQNVCGKDKVDYIVNSQPGKQKIILLDHAKREEERQNTKLQARLENEMGGRNNDDAEDDDDDKPKLTGHRLRRRERKQRQKKKMLGVQMNSDEQEKEMDFDDEETDGTTDWDYLYGALELFTRKRKQIQVWLLRSIIAMIKRRFNREFEYTLQIRNARIEKIGDINGQILEILESLETSADLFSAPVNIIENPEQVLQVQDSDVPFEKYVTKAKIAQMEQERLDEEERLRKMQQDDAGVRALKQMMNNTIDEKKDHKLVEELVEEEWMKKEESKMTNEELLKLEDFRAKKAILDEEREKKKKKLMQDLKKLQKDIEKRCIKFDRRLFVLFTKRMEFSYRVLEQEVYIIKLKQSVLGEKKNDEDLTVIGMQLEILEEQKKEISFFSKQLEDFHQKVASDVKESLQAEKAVHADEFKKKWRSVASYYNGDNLEYQALAKQYSKKQHKEFLQRNPHLEKRLNELDPNFKIEGKLLYRLGAMDVESYINEGKVKTMLMRTPDSGKPPISVDDLVELQSRIQHTLKTQKLMDLVGQTLQENERDLVSVDNHIETSERNGREDRMNIQKAYSNIYLQLRFCKEFVEIDLNNVVDLLQDAILIKKSLIDGKNKEIKRLGEMRVKAMKLNMDKRYETDTLKYDVLTKDLEIENDIIESMAITRMKVTKKLQAALAKSDDHMAENEEKNLNDQRKKLAEATKNRIKIFSKKEKAMRKEIEALKEENRELKLQGAKLEEAVKERQHIFEITEDDKDVEGDDEFKRGGAGQDRKVDKMDPKRNPAYKNAMELAKNRRLFDKVKKCTDEFMMLMEELKILKERTFPQIPARPNNFIQGRQKI